MENYFGGNGISFKKLNSNGHFLFLLAAELLSDLEGAFQEKIDVAYFDTSKYLLDVLNRNYLLLEHLQAMRRYLLLGQGDFIRHLMDLLKLAGAPSPSRLSFHDSL